MELNVRFADNFAFYNTYIHYWQMTIATKYQNY